MQFQTRLIIAIQFLPHKISKRSLNQTSRRLWQCNKNCNDANAAFKNQKEQRASGGWYYLALLFEKATQKNLRRFKHRYQKFKMVNRLKDVQKYKEEEKYEQLLFLKVGRLRGDFGHHGWIRICLHVNFPRRQQTNVLILVRNPFSRKKRGTKPNSKSDPSAKRTCKIPSQRDGHKFQTKQTKAVRLTSAIVDFFEFHRKNVRHACGKILRNRQGRART